MAIRIDFSSESVVVVCDKCPQWRALRGDRVTAWAAAAEHEREAHDGQQQASLAYGMARRRELQDRLKVQLLAQAAKVTQSNQGSETS